MKLIFFRYLTRTFGLAYHHVKPDIILFLGDLMDEGSTAPPDEYLYAYERFMEIFSVAKYTKVNIPVCQFLYKAVQSLLLSLNKKERYLFSCKFRCF